MKKIISLMVLGCLFINVFQAYAQEDLQNRMAPTLEDTAHIDVDEVEDLSQEAIFDDKLLLQGYSEKYQKESQDTITAMIKDDTLNPLKMAAAIRVFRQEYSEKLFSREKILMEKTLLRRLNRTDSPFVQVEAMHALVVMNRYRYFKSMVPALILKLDHYNATVNELVYEYLNSILEKGSTRTREARIVFNTLRKVLFLSRKRLAEVKKPDARLQQKIKLVRWAIKTLGSQEIRRLPPEAIHLF